MPNDRRKATVESLAQEVLAKLDHYAAHGFPESRRIHELIMQANPALCPRLWYGMPGYAKSKDSAVLCFFRKDTYISFGVTESISVERFAPQSKAFPSAWYIKEIDEEVEQLITLVVIRATTEVKA